MSRGSRGFTLIEVLVVVVLISLMSYLLMQSMSQVMFLRFRFVHFLETLQVGKMQEQWFRQVASSVTTDLPPATNIFKGDGKEFTAKVLNPLQGPIGVPTSARMRLVKAGVRVYLKYTELGSELDLGSWVADQASFSYLDKEGELHNQWPPDMMRKPHLTPYGVLLRINDVTGPVVWFAAVRQRHTTWSEKKHQDMD
jgi:general secretion pathway protein J